MEQTRQFIMRNKPQFLPRCSLKTAILTCVFVQLMFIVPFGPMLFHNDVQEYHISGRPEATERVYSLLSDSTTASDSPTHPTTTAHPRTMPLFEGDLKKEASLFIQWYEKTCKEERRNASNGLQLCPCVPPELKGRLLVHTRVPSWDAIARANTVVRPGGKWSPTDCRNTEQLAIIVPYRDRDDHLRIFLNHMHPILRRQMISYRIFVVEQAFPEVFNKASMMNIGFVEATKFASYDCFIFHDVDMVLEDDRHMYRCSDTIRHMGVNIDKLGYRLHYVELFGGATAFRKTHFEQVNGFANKFYGWGGEDDDMWHRIRAQKLTVVRYPPSVSRYTMIKHRRDFANQKNPYSEDVWTALPDEYQRDGLTSLKYTLHEIQLRPLYTWVYAEPVTAVEQFDSYWGYSDQGTYLTKKINLVDCAAKCAAQPACKAFTMYQFLCTLKTTPFLRRRCRRFECDLIYVKKTYSKQLELLQRFVEVPGSCSETGRKNVSQPLDLVRCASACDHATDCLAFVHKASPDACVTTLCSVLESTNTSSVFYKIPPNILTHFTSRGGDCKGSNIEGAFLSLQQCATKCIVTAECVGFTFVKDASKSCCLKRQTCKSTEDINNVVMYDRM